MQDRDAHTLGSPRSCSIPELSVAEQLFEEGYSDAAAESLLELIDHDPTPGALTLLARISSSKQNFRFATQLISRALGLEPAYLPAQLVHAQVLLQQLRFHAVGTLLEPLYTSHPGHGEIAYLLALAKAGLGRHSEAIGLLTALIGEGATPALHLLRGHSLKALGRSSEAVTAYRAAIAMDSRCVDAYWSLASAKLHRFTDEEIQQMRALLGNGLSPALLGPCHFALAKAFAERREYAASWAHYEFGNLAMRLIHEYPRSEMETRVDDSARAFSPKFFSDRASWGTHRPDPIFIVGMPRSGSSLVEQILASHSMIEGTDELPEIPRIALELIGDGRGTRRYPFLLQFLTAEDCRELGERYLSAAGTFRQTTRPNFVDKMPNNFRHIGLIHLILPRARIIDVRREPMACCFSNLTQLYAQGHEFSYSMEDAAHYYKSYIRLMAHWNTVIPGAVHRVHYEDLVDSPKRVVTALLEFCGVPFEPGCLQFHNTVRGINTPSSLQVRQPLYRDGLDHWRHYDAWLEPLRRSLGSALSDFRL